MRLLLIVAPSMAPRLSLSLLSLLILACTESLSTPRLARLTVLGGTQSIQVIGELQTVLHDEMANSGSVFNMHT